MGPEVKMRSSSLKLVTCHLSPRPWIPNHVTVVGSAPKGPIRLWRRHLGAGSLVVLLLSGCVKRAILIDSDPPGATVSINGQEVGQTPLTHEFITHGRYVFRLTKPGFQEVVAREKVRAPWHQWIPLDLFTELLIPITFDDRHRFSYRLSPATPAQRIAVEPAPDVEELTVWLRGSSDPGRRRQVCFLMARHRLVEGVPALQEATADPNPEVRASALQAFRILAGPEALSPLLAALREDPSPIVRWQAAAELEVLRLPEALAALTAALGDRDAMVRVTAVEALRRLGDPTAALAVSRRLTDSDIVVRRSAASALGRLNDRSVAPQLARSLRDPDPEVRRRASKSLRTLKAPGVSTALAQALRDSDPEVRATVIDALGEFGTSQAVPVALRYVRAWQPATREAAATALGRIKDPRAIPALRRSVQREPNPFTRLAMAKALVELGDMPSDALAPYTAAVNAEAERQRAKDREQEARKAGLQRGD